MLLRKGKPSIMTEVSERRRGAFPRAQQCSYAAKERKRINKLSPTWEVSVNFTPAGDPNNLLGGDKSSGKRRRSA